MGYYDPDVPRMLSRITVADCAGMYELGLVTCNCEAIYCDGYKFETMDRIRRNDRSHEGCRPAIDWKKVAESVRPCINCGHSLSTHVDGECQWRYFRIFRIFGACKCKEQNGGNIWPPIVLAPGESVEFSIGFKR